MSQIKVHRHGFGSNSVTNVPLEIKRISMPSSIQEPESGSSEAYSEESSELSQNSSGTSATPKEHRDYSEESQGEESSSERRSKRKEEYREANQIRTRAIEMQKKAEAQLKETQDFKTFMQQAKEDPTAIAKALGMSPEELQRKFFNKMYSIKEEVAAPKEETFEEQTKRRLESYESERAQEKESQAQKAREYAQTAAAQTKNSYIRDSIMPAISEDHELILANGREACAAMIYDTMNALYQDEARKAYESGREFHSEDFSLRPIDVINQMEEELIKAGEAQLMKSREIKKFKKYFGSEDRSEYSGEIQRKDFGAPQRRVQSSPTLSSSSLGGAPSALLSSGRSSFGGSDSARIPLSNRDARRERAKRNLGS